MSDGNGFDGRPVHLSDFLSCIIMAIVVFRRPMRDFSTTPSDLRVSSTDLAYIEVRSVAMVVYGRYPRLGLFRIKCGSIVDDFID